MFRSKPRITYQVAGAERTDVEQILQRLAALQRETIGVSAILRSVIDGIAQREKLNNADVIFDIDTLAFVPKPKAEDSVAVR